MYCKLINCFIEKCVKNGKPTREARDAEKPVRRSLLANRLLGDTSHGVS